MAQTSSTCRDAPRTALQALLYRRETETGNGGEAIEHEIPFMKGYTVFNVEQIDAQSLLPGNDRLVQQDGSSELPHAPSKDDG